MKNSSFYACAAVPSCDRRCNFRFTGNPQDDLLHHRSAEALELYPHKKVWWCLFFKKLNTLYLKLFSGKIYLVFWGFEKAECFLTLECLCPCSNGSYYTCRKRSRAPEPHCPQPGVPVCTSQGCSEMTEHQHFGYCSDHLSNWEQYLQVETQILVFNPSLALSFL